LESLRKSIAAIEPRFAKHVESLTDWHQFSLLSVESSFCPKWYLPGLLLIGDAAHVMSPIGGVGINYAIQDAVAAANLLGEHLKARSISIRDLASVQRRRAWQVRIMQLIQAQMLRGALAAGAARPSGAGRLGLAVGTWLLNRRSGMALRNRVIGLGIRRERVPA